jgi:hypothetical protein
LRLYQDWTARRFPKIWKPKLMELQASVLFYSIYTYISTDIFPRKICNDDLHKHPYTLHPFYIQCKGRDPGVDWCISQSFIYLYNTKTFVQRRHLYRIQKRMYKDDIYITKTTCTTLERLRHIRRPQISLKKEIGITGWWAGLAVWP